MTTVLGLLRGEASDQARCALREIARKETDALFAKYDTNTDGSLSLDEFTNIAGRQANTVGCPQAQL